MNASKDILSQAFDINITKLLDIQFEFAPDPKSEFLDDGTAFDTFFLCETAVGRCGISVEVKYTEQAYKVGASEAKKEQDPNSTYWKTTASSNHFIHNDDIELGEDELRQIWRNHLLGLSMVKQGHLDEFYSLTVYPSGIHHFVEAIPNYQTKLKDEFQHTVKGITFETFIESIKGEGEILEWKRYLRDRYIP